MKTGDKIPSCSFEATSHLKGNLDDYRGQWLVVYFYPKDKTPGCTTESQDFSYLYPKFKAVNCEVLGISRDSLNSHESFKSKNQLPFELISDTDESLCQTFDVIKMKNRFGKETRGIERSTFLIDPLGEIKQVWRNVKVKDHAQEVLSTLQSYQ